MNKENKVLLTPQSIEDHILPDVPPPIAELIRITVLGKNYRNYHVETHPQRTSSLITVQYTHQSLRSVFAELEVEHNKSAPVIKRHLLVLAKVFPQLVRYSQDDEGNQVLSTYTARHNKKVVSKFFQFPVFDVPPDPRQPTYKVYTDSDVRDMPELVTNWMVGRRKLTGINPERYFNQYITDNDYFDPSAAKDADWDTLLAKPKIGRPCKPADPFNRTKTPAQRRNSLKSVAEQLNRIEATQHRIEATQQRIEQFLTSQ